MISMGVDKCDNHDMLSAVGALVSCPLWFTLITLYLLSHWVLPLQLGKRAQSSPRLFAEIT